MNIYIIGFRQKGNRYGDVIREQTVLADNARAALAQTYTDRAARSETWKVISKLVGDTRVVLITIDEFRANINSIDLSKL